VLFPELIEVLDPEPHDAALNMAIDEVLLRGATAPLLRVYRWARPAVSFGYFGRHAEVAAAWPARELVRRWTGGGVVPHGSDVTYTLIAPREAGEFCSLNASDSYRAIHECIARLLGERVTLAPAAAPKVSSACFENAAQHDVLAGGHKLAGAAQRRTRHGLLHQGSVQLSSGQDLLRERLANAFSPGVKPRELTPDEFAAAGELAKAKYGSEGWNRRM